LSAIAPQAGHFFTSPNLSDFGAAIGSGVLFFVFSKSLASKTISNSSRSIPSASALLKRICFSFSVRSPSASASSISFSICSLYILFCGVGYYFFLFACLLRFLLYQDQFCTCYFADYTYIVKSATTLHKPFNNYHVLGFVMTSFNL